jgi:RND family efflux transporter MFP subunit
MNYSNAALASDREGAFSTQLPGAATDENFCASWLSLQCQMIDGVTTGSVLLGAPDCGPYRPTANWPDGQDNTAQLAATATRALEERSALIIHRTARAASNGSPQQWYEVAYPVLVANRLYGVVVLKISARPQAQLESALQQLSWGAAWLEVFVLRQSGIENAAKSERLQTVLDVLATSVEHERFIEAATAFVTDLAVRLECERVSLGFNDGHHIRVKSMSHSARFGKRANLTRAIEAAMEETLDQEARIVFPSDSGTRLQITRRHEELARLHGAGVVCSVPLGREGQIYGVLTFERLADNPFNSSTIELCEAIAALAGPILELKFNENKSLKKRTTEAVRKRIALLIGPSYLAPKIAAMGLMFVIIFSSLVAVQYRVPAKTVIEAQTQRAAVAPFNGYIAAARVRAGDLVRQGEILATLDNRDLKLEQLKWSSQKEQFVKQYNLAMAQHNAAQVKITAAQVAQADAELALIEDQLGRTDLRAPIDGLVVSGDLSQSIGAPTERGQILFEVAPLDAYRIILQVDEREAAEIAVGQKGKIVLSASPTTPLSFTVEKMTPVSAAREGRNYFRVEAKMENAPAQLRPGMEGVGKIDIGQRRLIWLWTHRGMDWLRLWVWTWLP